MPPLVIFGFTGVHMFFVLSGYLLFRPFLSRLLTDNPLPSLANFYLRRFLRIVPCYLVALACYTAIRYLTHQKLPDTFNLITHALLVFNYFPSIDIYSINGVFWTLAIEAQYYLLLPLIVLLVTKVFRFKQGKAVITIIAIFLLVGVMGRLIEFHIWENQPRTLAFVRFRTVFSFMDMFGFGMLTAYLGSIPTLFKRHYRVLQWSLLTMGLALFIFSNNWVAASGHSWLAGDNLLIILMFPVLICLGQAMLLLVLSSSSLGRSRFLTQRPLLFVGEISYSLYLYHLGVQFCMFKLISLEAIPNFQFRGFCYGLLFLPPSLLVAYIMYLIVEKPSLGWVEKFRNR